MFAPTNNAISALMTARPELAAYQTRADLAEALAAYHGVACVRAFVRADEGSNAMPTMHDVTPAHAQWQAACGCLKRTDPQL